jgi:hypothetical protein
MKFLGSGTSLSQIIDVVRLRLQEVYPASPLGVNVRQHGIEAFYECHSMFDTIKVKVTLKMSLDFIANLEVRATNTFDIVFVCREEKSWKRLVDY